MGTIYVIMFDNGESYEDVCNTAIAFVESEEAAKMIVGQLEIEREKDIRLLSTEIDECIVAAIERKYPGLWWKDNLKYAYFYYKGIKNWAEVKGEYYASHD